MSTHCFKSDNPLSATSILFFPSKSNGFVTTATVNIPRSFAALAITGAAPEPVPPPIPVVINNIFTSANSDKISSIDSSADFLPISESDPAPSPKVKFLPNCICLLVRLLDKAWPSVFATINSIFSTFALIIVLTAFPPAPPMPITDIFGSVSFIFSGIVILSDIVFSFVVELILFLAHKFSSNQ